MYLLIIVFFINGEAVTPDGWGPRTYATAEACVERADFTRRYLLQHMTVDDFRAACLRSYG